MWIARWNELAGGLFTSSRFRSAIRPFTSEGNACVTKPLHDMRSDMEPPLAPILYGAAYNVYVRAVRLTLAEKGVGYQLVEMDLSDEEGAPANYLHSHTFMRIPAFEHEGFRLYEASAITRYVDEAFDGPPLMPLDVHARARVNHAISIVENYCYGPMVWVIFIERCRSALYGRSASEEKIAAAIPQVAFALDALEQMADVHGPHFMGRQLTLADLHLAAMLAYGTLAPEGADLVNARPRLKRWWADARKRPSLQDTRSPMEE
jgi:glutathione S-transferase